MEKERKEGKRIAMRGMQRDKKPFFPTLQKDK